jgi:mannose/fructose/N-acetylgalactosamine-specific phosphotransferase system component IIB
VAEAPESLLRGDTPPATTMVLLSSPAVVTALYDAGVRYAALNLGCLGVASGRVRVAPQISLSPGEAEALQYLASLGVVVTAQALPSDAPIALDALVRRLARSKGRSGSA